MRSSARARAAAVGAVIVVSVAAVVTLPGPVRDHVLSRLAGLAQNESGAGGRTAAEQMPRGPFYMRSGAYRTRTAERSDQAGSERGRLLKLSKPGGTASFVMAFDHNVDTHSLPLRGGWTAEEVGRDPMWMPEACAQRPSWLVGGRYLLVSDARYEGFEVIDGYVIYDLVRQTFTYFTVSDDSKGNGPAKVLSVAVESDTFVLYLDVHDQEGPYRSDPAYRHSAAHHNGFVVRRVISPRDLSYADYHVPFQSPPVDDYTLQVFGRSPGLFLGVNDGAQSTVAMGADDENPATLAIAPLVPDRRLELRPGGYVGQTDPAAEAATSAVVAAVKTDGHRSPDTTGDVDAHLVAQAPGLIYLRASSMSSAASLPAEFDVGRQVTTLPLGDDFRSAGFVVAVAP